MATSAFKSTTKRTPIGSKPNPDDSNSSNKPHRRSRSLSRFSRLPPELTTDFGDIPAPKGRFVNTVRGSDFPEISLDDLAIEFFPLKDSVDEKNGDRGRSYRRSSEVSASTSGTAPSQRRGRSVSRQKSRAGDGQGSTYNASGSGSGRAVSDANSRRRRSVSVARYQISDSESDRDHSQSSTNHANMKSIGAGRSQMTLLQQPTASSDQRLGRSLSRRDLSKSHDGYSSQSSALTDDEARVSHYGNNEIEKTIRAVYAQTKAEHPTGDDVNSGLFEAMRKELRYAVEEIRTDLEQTMVRKTSALAIGDRLQSDNSDVLQVVSAITKKYATKLEQSEKRKQELLAEIVLEEQRGKELSKIVRELLPDSKSSAPTQKPSPARKRSNDRSRMSKRLTKEAEKYFEDFTINVEDTDISSFDGERSDASSTLGGIAKPREAVTEAYQSPSGYNSLPVEMEGVILPWLQWETSNNGSSLPSKNKIQLPVTPKTLSWDAAQDITSMQDPSSHSASSHGNWSPGVLEGHIINTGEDDGSKSSYQRSRFDMDKYLKLKHDEDLLFEIWRERNRINSGGLLLCSNVLYL